MTRLSIGAATLTVFNTGDLQTYLAESLNVCAEDWPQYQAALAHPIPSPMQTVHIALGNASVIVDAGQWNFTPDSEYWLPGYTPPPDIAMQLRAAHIQPEAVTHVVVTHAHFDHFNALVIGETITFPHARHYLGRADWDAKAQDPGSEAGHVFGTLHQRGQLTLVEGDLEIADGITLLAAPGETPGHQIVRVQSQGHTLYCIGDLYHHEVELEQPNWNVSWADPAANRASRQQLRRMAQAEHAQIIASHIREIISPDRLQEPSHEVGQA